MNSIKSSPMQSAGPKHFIIDGLPRTGSTTLATLIACHPEINCLIEPFHPRRYGSQFHRMAVTDRTITPVLALLRHRWVGLKHVWEPSTGWPFVPNPQLNEELVLNAGKVIFIQRRNLLKRFVSGAISSHLRFWIGTRTEFLARLQETSLPSLDVEAVRQAIQLERNAINARRRLLEGAGIPTFVIDYEEIYGKTISDDQQEKLLNDILAFLGFSTIDHLVFTERCLPLLNPDTYQWASDDVYKRIPGIRILNAELGSDETGWLFQ